jgi:hypothetical protein
MRKFTLYTSHQTRTIKRCKIQYARHVALVGEKKNSCRFLVGKPKGKKQLVTHTRRWEDNIKMDVTGIV